MKYFKDTLIKMFKKDDLINFRPLHRWSIDYSHNTINRKIDMANEDNCGPCGKFVLKPQKLEIQYNYDNINISPFRISNIDFMVHEELK